MIAKLASIFTFAFLMVNFSSSAFAIDPGCVPYDFNGDGTIDNADSQLVGFRFGTKQGDPNYDVKYDVNKDGQINQADIDTMFNCENLEPSGPPNQPVTDVKDVRNPVAFGSVGELLSKALPFVFGLVGLLAVVVFSIGALRYLASRGDPKAVDGARGTMTGAIVGLVIVLGAAASSSVIQSVFGLGLFGTGNRPDGPGASGGVDLRCAFELTAGKCIGDQFANFGQLVSFVLLLLLSIGGLLFFFMIVWGGFRFLLARGDEKAVAEARGTLTNAAIGLLLILAALVIIRLISSMLFGEGVQF